MAGDKKLSQGKILQVPNPKAGLTFFMIDNYINYVLDLEAVPPRKKLLTQMHQGNYLRENFQFIQG